MLNLNYDNYKRKVLGCWMGKNIGGTLGAPMEWYRQFNNVNFYQQDLKGNPEPNDDLDLQLLWLISIEELGFPITAQRLSQYWMWYLTPHWCEYGNAKINMRSGLLPPLSGSVNNIYKHSAGGWIRSEIWACLSPGYPQQAALLAREDAIVDHGDKSEGLYSMIFSATMESAAFIESDIRRLIQIGLSYIPADCGTARAVKQVIHSQESGLSWKDARNKLLKEFRGSAWTNKRSRISDEDFEQGFATGQQGWDAPSNIGIIIIGLLYGNNEFEKTICTAINCGEDTDCTGATIGSLYGIMHGIEIFPAKWTDPIGRRINTITVDLGDLTSHMNESYNRATRLPEDIDELTERTIKAAERTIYYYRIPIHISRSGKPESTKVDIDIEKLRSPKDLDYLYRSTKGPSFTFDTFDVMVEYVDGPFFAENRPTNVKLYVINKYKFQENLNISWYTHPNCKVLPSSSCKVHIPHADLGNPEVELEFQLIVSDFYSPSVRSVVEITIDGKPTTLLVPILLLKDQPRLQKSQVFINDKNEER